MTPISVNQLVAISSGNGSMTGRKFRQDLFEPVKRALNVAAESRNREFEIDSSLYANVYVTSDLHADLRKFIQILERHSLITLPESYPYFYKDENIYDASLLDSITWNKSGALFVIVGDLVDGKFKNVSSVDDENGSFELLLHAFIYNLRIKANAKQSEILFVAGDHDLHTVILNSSNVYINDFVTDNAKHFFNATGGEEDESAITKNTMRANALLPFYLNSPYYLLRLMNGASCEITFVHGGLRDSTNDNHVFDFSGILKDLQTLIQTNVHNYSNDDDLITLIDESSPLSMRYYAEKPKEKCGGENLDENSDCKVLVVGHCKTHEYTQLEMEMNDKPAQYVGCDKKSSDGRKKGCVVGRCLVDVNGHEMPSQMFVDVGLSSAFYPNIDSLNERDVEILKFTHTEGSTHSYYYDTIMRIDLYGNRHIYNVVTGYRYEANTETLPSLMTGRSSIQLSKLLCGSVENPEEMKALKDAVYDKMIVDVPAVDTVEQRQTNSTFEDLMIENHALQPIHMDESIEKAPDFKLSKIQNDVEKMNVLIEFNHYRIPFMKMQRTLLRACAEKMLDKLTAESKVVFKEKMKKRQDASDEFYKTRGPEMRKVRATMQKVLDTLNVAKIYHTQLEEYNGNQ